MDLRHTLCFKSVLMRDGNGAHLAECWPTTRGSGFDLQCHIKTGVVVHSCNPSTLDMEAGDKTSKVIYLWLYSELEPSMEYVRLLFQPKTKKKEKI